MFISVLVLQPQNITYWKSVDTQYAVDAIYVVLKWKRGVSSDFSEWAWWGLDPTMMLGLFLHFAQ